jgi:hypothetical protein
MLLHECVLVLWIRVCKMWCTKCWYGIHFEIDIPKKTGYFTYDVILIGKCDPGFAVGKWSIICQW